ncbi:Dcc family protein [Thalictrum thalictroides]|uniref:Dcc family protein n=1 Tax=Thalictrum thalictroides TaxID=46969 RepID=A0A7J6X627_THATH|nr:Dcc family protein [Thalictrum thalictroides]
MCQLDAKLLKLDEGERNQSKRYTSFAEEMSDAVIASAADVIPGEELIFTEEPNTVPKTSVLPSLLQPRVVVYDGVCHLCHAGVKWVINADKHEKIKFCCLQSKAAEPYLRACGLDRKDVLRRFLFVEGPGSYHQASTAALKVASYLPLPYSALSALFIVPTPLRDAIYDYVAKNRYNWFGKDDDCIVLREMDMLERFIDREELVEKNRWKL